MYQGAKRAPGVVIVHMLLSSISSTLISSMGTIRCLCNKNDRHRMRNLLLLAFFFKSDLMQLIFSLMMLPQTRMSLKRKKCFFLPRDPVLFTSNPSARRLRLLSAIFTPEEPKIFFGYLLLEAKNQK